MDAAAITKGAGAQSMDKQQFLKLFTTQLQHQDPLNPMDTSQFSSQLAQLTQVEQMMNMNKGVEKLIAVQENMNRTASTGMIGNLVKLNDGTEGRVMGVRFEEGGPFMLLDKNIKVSMADIKETYKFGFNPAPANNQSTADASQPDVNKLSDVKGIQSDKGAQPEVKAAQSESEQQPKTDWHNMSEVGQTQVVGRGISTGELKPDEKTSEKFVSIDNVDKVK
jgi:flagellar basal-body rod modification protein FlgD